MPIFSNKEYFNMNGWSVSPFDWTTAVLMHQRTKALRQILKLEFGETCKTCTPMCIFPSFFFLFVFCGMQLQKKGYAQKKRLR